MTKTFLVSALFACILPSILPAQDTNSTKVLYDHEVSILVGDSENGYDQGLDRSIAYEIQYMYKGFNFPIKPEFAFVYSNNIPIYYSQEKASYSSLLLNAVYEIEYIDLLSPYVKAGLGYRHSIDTTTYAKDHLLFNTGGGLKMRLDAQWILKAEIQANFSNQRDNLLAMIGLSYEFGEKLQHPNEKTTQVK